MNTSKSVTDAKKTVASRIQDTIGANMSFAAREAYKLLRTNLLFALSDSDSGKARVVGVTSSLRGEGKSTTSINLAYTLAETNRRVLLVEGDFRIPSIHKKLKVRSKPGVSNVLVTRCDPERHIQQYRFNGEESVTIHILAAGDIPPNPSELMGSKRMRDMIDRLAQSYDYIILDLPPINAVTDALVATDLVDGMVMVVRNEYTDRGSLNEAIRQIELVNGKILGFVFTCANTGAGGYGKKYKYKYRYRYYNSKYYK